MTTSSTNSNAEIIKLGIVLAIYAVLSCTLVAIVNWWTLPVITENKAAQAKAAMQKIFPDASNFEPLDAATKINGVSVTDVYKAQDSSGSVIGVVCTGEGATYDRAKIMIGVSSEGKVSGVEFLELTDSPGFGQKARDSAYKVSSGKTFTEQFIGMECSAGFTANKNFDAITGATITSVGIASILNAATQVAMGNLDLSSTAASAVSSATSAESSDASSEEQTGPAEDTMEYTSADGQ